ncbi:uncharacterized protein [Epargyreus clarus]|uniref:uncharacterized protein n=1 Tax=Epargyreus clarus TaxID=520877 RepID=UPI003C2F70D9
MLKVFTVAVLLVLVCGTRSDGPNLIKDKEEKSSRQKRLLFYDEQGNLVKTYGNTFVHDLTQNGDKNPFFWNFMNPFFSFLRPANFGGSTIAYMIPVSDAVVQQINSNPLYHNKLLILSTRDPLIEPNPLCAGRRAQIPSPNLCSNYLNCWDGWAFEQECPAGLLFSVEGYCDYPYKVDCQNRRLKDTPQPKCVNDFESFRNETNCNEFFVCVHSVPVRFKCPADLAYSQRLGVCDYPFRVECNSTLKGDAAASTSPVQPASDAMSTSTAATSTSATLSSSSSPISSSTPGIKDTMIQKIDYNTQSWSSTHVAISRQDAIRQLKLGSMAQIKTD